MQIAALFVATNGVYCNIPGIDFYDKSRNAFNYNGPHSVVAHPPCERWGRYAAGGPNPYARRRSVGDDGGCFAHALYCVRTFGGVLEHPEASLAFAAHGIAKPPRAGDWWLAGDGIGYICCVEQGHYGHPARKRTWLYAVCPQSTLPALHWGPSESKRRLDAGFHASWEREAAKQRKFLMAQAGTPIIELPRLSAAEKINTPIEFRNILIAIASNAQQK